MLLPNFIEQRLWESNSRSASQEIPNLYGSRWSIAVFTSPAADPVLSQLNTVNTSFKSYVNIIFSLRQYLANCVFSSSFAAKTMCASNEVKNLNK
jgi:hypothetical protein